MPPPSDDPIPNSYRILIVDDSRDAAHVLRMLLRKIGHQVEVADNGKSGIELATTFLPEIVLCDISMPGMDGYQVAKSLRASETTRTAYLVALTGYGQDDDRAKALESGFDEHLIKPVGFATLQSLIATMPRREQG
jgi:CheY-like chemotaxis protein